jgi:hypothetical protein
MIESDIISALTKWTTAVRCRYVVVIVHTM